MMKEEVVYECNALGLDPSEFYFTSLLHSNIDYENVVELVSFDGSNVVR